MKLSKLIEKGIIVPGKMMLICNIERKCRGRGNPHHRVQIYADKNRNVRRVYQKSNIAHDRLIFIEFC